MQRFLKFVTVFLLLFCFTLTEAQEEKVTYKDKIYLKRGGMLRGTILQYNPGESVLVQFKYGEPKSFPDSLVSKVYMHKGNKHIENINSIPITEKRFYHEVQFAFLSNTNGSGVSLSYTALYQMNQRIAFGAGTGIDNYYAAPGREIVPIYGNAKYNLTSTTNAPYIGMKLGYGMAFEREDHNITSATGGLLTNPYFGVRLGTRGLIVNLFAGLKFQKVDYVFSNAAETRREDILHRRLEIGTSLMF